MHEYRPELFHAFVPSSARARVAGRRAPVLSGALVAQRAGALDGPVLELDWPGRAVLTGVFRAAHHEDAVIAVDVDASLRRSRPEGGRIVDEIFAAAEDARLDQPIILVARAAPWVRGEPPAAARDALFRDLDAGFTSICFLASAVAADVDAVAALATVALELDIGVELEVDVQDDGARAMALLDDAGIPLSAVRGRRDPMTIIGPMPVVQLEELTDSSTGERILIDRIIERAYRRAGPSMDVVTARGLLDEATALRVEAFAYGEVGEACAALGARGTSGRLLEALAAAFAPESPTEDVP